MQIRMSPSVYIVHFISQFEELQLQAYKKDDGIWTVGYGHTGPDVREGTEVTAEQALRLLHGDVESASRDVNNQVSIELTQNQFDALVSLVFNIGGGPDGFKGSELRRLLNQGQIVAAAAQFPRWDHIKGVVSSGLLRRRLQERDLFLAPVKAA